MAEGLPIDKLARPRHLQAPRKPCVLVSCGSFNPPTNMHMRMFELARQELAQRGYDVWGGYMSPVGDAYGKPGLAPARDRVAMCEAAAATSDFVMVDSWEARRAGYTRTLEVLRHVQHELQQHVLADEKAAATASFIQTAPDKTTSQAEATGASDQQQQQQQHGNKRRQRPACGHSGHEQQQPMQVMLVCGGDMLATMEKPGVWVDPDKVLSDFGVVCVAREGTDIVAWLDQPGSLLGQHRDHVILVVDPVPNAISSTKIREELTHGRTVKYLIPDATLQYITQSGLYKG